MRIGVDAERMSPEQAEVHRAIAAGPRGAVPLPFLAMMDAPRLTRAVQAVGEAIRFSGTLSPDLREVAILATAAAFGSGYEWSFHLPIARRLGVAEPVLLAAAGGVEAAGAIDPICAATIALCRRAVLERRVAPELIVELVGLIGREAASEVVAISGYYPLLGLFLSAAGVDIPVAAPEAGRPTDRSPA